jgi:hypothetical protein
MSHTHKAKPSASRERAWMYCVTPDECAAKPERQVAHGNIHRVDVCSCGAQRISEINGGRINFGPWSGEDEA